MSDHPTVHLPRRALLAGVLGWPLVAGARDATPAPAAARTLRWDELVPKDWDPMKRFRDANSNLTVLSDDSPQGQAMMKELREAWDNAPTIAALDGQQVRLPGYLVPLDDSRRGLKEFLIVPYFGACIHTPPPPANQIVHVRSDRQPVTGFKSMDAVWVTGTLKVHREATSMGQSGYRIEASGVERYQAPERR